MFGDFGNVWYYIKMLKDGEINWVETLAQIAGDKGQTNLAAYIRTFGEGQIPQEVVTHDYSKLSTRTFNITTMPEATCDGCQ